MAKKKETKTEKTEMQVATAVESLLPENFTVETLEANFQNADQLQLPRARFKGGEFLLAEGEEGQESFEGVILHYTRQNTYWESGYNPSESVPPTCFSSDGKIANRAAEPAPGSKSGTKFGKCSTCALNEWGSGPGKGKACRNQIKLYVHQVGKAVPTILYLAPTSIGLFENSFLMHSVLQSGLILHQIVTRFVAKKVPGATYFQVKFEVADKLTGDLKEQAIKLREFWMDAMSSPPVAEVTAPQEATVEDEDDDDDTPF